MNICCSHIALMHIHYKFKSLIICSRCDNNNQFYNTSFHLLRIVTWFSLFIGYNLSRQSCLCMIFLFETSWFIHPPQAFSAVFQLDVKILHILSQCCNIFGHALSVTKFPHMYSIIILNFDNSNFVEF